MRRNDLDQAAFCTLTGFKSQGYLSQICRNTRPPPLHVLETWGQVLRLNADESAMFRALAQAAHLQRKLDREGIGRTAVVTQISPANYAINAITGQGRELLILTPHQTAPLSLEQRLAEAERQRDAALRDLANLRAQLGHLAMPDAKPNDTQTATDIADIQRSLAYEHPEERPDTKSGDHRSTPRPAGVPHGRI